MMILTPIILTFLHSGHGQKFGEENVCIKQILQSKMVNITYMEAVRIKKHKWCFSPPIFQCAEWHNTMETRWKLENVTRLANLPECCSGYSLRDGECKPRCSKSCLNGLCSAPETCSCNSGFSGESCDTVGCPGGKWGNGCSNECSCQNGGFCHPVTGSCRCTPGYTGLHCDSKCSSGSYGGGCTDLCSCEIGYNCHHVTGECTPCSRDLYGDHCRYKCDCDQEGTELCSHKNGRCFCKGNWFGRTCDLHCPFGYVNSTCYTQPVHNSSCHCPNDLYKCSMELGCVCPQGEDCGVENVNLNVKLAPYSANDHVTASTGVTIVAILIVAIVAVILVIVYYRKRMKGIKKDLRNLSVYYSDGGSLDSSGTHDLIVRDFDPLNAGNETINNLINTNNIHHSNCNTTLMNNVRVTLESQRYQATAASSNIAVKNINVENVKLNVHASCEDLEVDGAVGSSYSNTNNIDVNVFHDDFKSNISSRYQNKAAKADLEVMIRNNLKEERDKNYKRQKNNDDTNENDEDVDFISKLKVNISNEEKSYCD